MAGDDRGGLEGVELLEVASQPVGYELNAKEIGLTRRSPVRTIFSFGR